MSPITTHVLDTSKGTPAAGLSIKLEMQDSEGNWKTLAQGETNADGRITDLLDDASFVPGIFQMTFQTKAYFQKQNLPCFYPFATVVFEIEDTAPHYHIPLLLSSFGYTTYRGS